MPNTLNPACPLCGLRFENQPIMELHIREDHRRRASRESNDDGDPGITRSPTTGADNLADANEPAAAPSRTSTATATATATGGPAGRRGRVRRAKTALRRTLRILR